MPTNRILIAGAAAHEIAAAFDAYNSAFRALTQRTRRLFEARAWGDWQGNAASRIDLYGEHLQTTITALESRLGPLAYDASFWALVKTLYAEVIGDDDDRELYKTFFNSLTRHFFRTEGVNASIEFVNIEAGPIDRVSATPARRRYALGDPAATAVRVLHDFAVLAPWGPPEVTADRLCRWLTGAAKGCTELELLKTPFFRNSRCFIVGRLLGPGDAQQPVVIALTHPATGVEIDACITSIDTISILFGFTRSYFHVDLARVAPTVAYLRQLLPHKAVSELYTVIGRAKQGKTERYRRLFRHLRDSRDPFVTAPGTRGMVMIVFTLPSHDLVFKVIRDRFAYPKQVKRKHVLASYDLIFRHDRVGRLVDAQEFRRLRFRLDRFDEEIRTELLHEATKSVEVSGDHLIIRHLYMERRLQPLNLYLKDATPAQAEAAVIDYGQAVRDLAVSNIFPGDLLLKNFGVTRHGRVVFYDYDEVCLLTDCNFRALLPARDDFEALSEQTWFQVGPADVFPEQFPAFVGLRGHLREVFTAHHGELFTLAYWRDLQEKLRRGDVIDVRPYREQIAPGPLAPL